MKGKRVGGVVGRGGGAAGTGTLVLGISRQRLDRVFLVFFVVFFYS